MTFLYLLFFIIIAVVLAGLLFVVKVVRTILGLGRRMTGNQSQTRQNQNNYTQSNTSNYSYQSESPREDKKKVFDKDEGEYIDFEEIKD